jgi:hypothetical protein
MADQFHPVGSDHLLPDRAVGRHEPGNRIVVRPQQPTNRTQIGKLITWGRPTDRTADVLENLSPLPIATQRPRGPVEPNIAQVSEKRIDRRRPRPNRPAHGIADADHALDDIARQRVLFHTQSVVGLNELHDHLRNRAPTRATQLVDAARLAYNWR